MNKERMDYEYYRTMFLGSPARQVLMFEHEYGDGNIDLLM